MDKKLSNKLVSDIKKKILSGDLNAGDRLPSERELTAEYNVSRITVRDAISQLVYLGFLYTMPQSGTFVANYKKNTSLEFMVDVFSNYEEIDTPVLIEFYEMRRIFETYAAERAVIRMDDKHRKEIREMVNSMKEHIRNVDHLVDMDCKIHYLLIELANNNILRLVFNSFKQVYLFYLKDYYSVPENVVGILPYYERFCNAVDCKDERIAAFVMGELLDYSVRIKMQMLESGKE